MELLAYEAPGAGNPVIQVSFATIPGVAFSSTSHTCRGIKSFRGRSPVHPDAMVAVTSHGFTAEPGA